MAFRQAKAFCRCGKCNARHNNRDSACHFFRVSIHMRVVIRCIFPERLLCIPSYEDIHRALEQITQLEDLLHLRIRTARLPFGDCLPGYVQLLRKLFLSNIFSLSVKL